jgi:hypothetical protein
MKIDPVLGADLIGDAAYSFARFAGRRRVG